VPTLTPTSGAVLGLARSHRRKLPEAVTATNAAPAIGTATYRLTPKYPSASVTPMNSVTIHSRFTTSRSPSANVPQVLPKRSTISRA